MRTDYKDYIPTTELKEYQMIQNSNGSVSLEDVTDYLQKGDKLTAGVLNELSQNANWQLTHVKTGTVHALTGLGASEGMVSGVFRATADFSKGDTFTVDGEEHAIFLSNGGDAVDDMFVAGATIGVLIDVEGKKVNFKLGGGMRRSLITEIFTATTDWTVPSYLNEVTVRLLGAGGGGANGKVRRGGNGGYMAYETISVAPGEVIPITIGAGGAGGTQSTNSKEGSAGGASSFGTYLSAAGGEATSTSKHGVGAGGGGAPGGNTTFQGKYGGAGGTSGTVSVAGTNTVGLGLEFEGTGEGGAPGTAGATGADLDEDDYYYGMALPGSGGAAGGGGNGGYGGSGGKGGNGGKGGDAYPNSTASCDGGNGGAGGQGGGGGFGAPGGDGGQGGAGGNGKVVSSVQGGNGNGGAAGNGGGGGYGGPGGQGGNGGAGQNGSSGTTGSSGGHGGGGGYGPDGIGGNGSISAGGSGGIAAGGGGGGIASYSSVTEDRTGYAGGAGGDGICILTYWGYR